MRSLIQNVDLMQSLREEVYQAPFEIIDMTHVVTSNACVVEIAARIQQDVVYVKGTSRRAQGDPSDYQTGYMVALERALKSLHSKIQRRANGLVRHMDDMAEDRKRITNKETRHNVTREQKSPQGRVATPS